MSAPLIAKGDLRECLAALIEQAQERQAADPQRARRWQRLERYLTVRLAKRILREAEPGGRGKHGR